MAKARAVVNVVGAEAGAHQLLEQISLFVGPLCRAEARQGVAIFLPDALQPLGRSRQGFLPRGLAENLAPVARIDYEVGRFFDPFFSDQRLRQPVRMVRIVEAVAPLDAEAVVV